MGAPPPRARPSCAAVPCRSGGVCRALATANDIAAQGYRVTERRPISGSGAGAREAYAAGLVLNGWPARAWPPDVDRALLVGPPVVRCPRGATQPVDIAGGPAPDETPPTPRAGVAVIEQCAAWRR